MPNTDLYRSEPRLLKCAGSCSAQRPSEQGFMLLGLIVAIFLILLALGVAAPKVAQGLRREQEVETIHRGNQYVRAIQMYYRKVGHYPGTMEELEKTNNVRFLRQRYVDPMTGKVDWRVIHVGEAKTTVKGFFGKPLAGIAGSGLGSAAGGASPGGIGSTPGASNTSGSSIGSPSTAFGSTPGSSNNSSGTSSGFGSSDSSSGIGGEQSGGPFVGVGLAKSGNSITVLNEQTTYATWEFIYDPRIEQLKAKSSIFGGGMTSTNSTGLGSSSDSTSDKPSSSPNANPNPPTNPGTDGPMGGSGMSTSPQ
jgi:type II secretory pathway pseudopilin PulG